MHHVGEVGSWVRVYVFFWFVILVYRVTKAKMERKNRTSIGNPELHSESRIINRTVFKKLDFFVNNENIVYFTLHNVPVINFLTVCRVLPYSE